VREILGKLKHDAEEFHFQEEVKRAAITCPAKFDILERQAIEEMALATGFEEVEMLEEPVAAALAYSEDGQKVGNYLMVYDLGGGTFDLAVLRYDPDDQTFKQALPPSGIRACGGDDFDLRLYYHCDDIARSDLNRAINPQGQIDHRFLRECRKRKENLSATENTTISAYLDPTNGDEPVLFKQDVKRSAFEELIDDLVRKTSQLTSNMIEDADTNGFPVDTLVLIGGSSRVPLVDRTLSKTVEPLEPTKWGNQDYAVALGAAYRAQRKWGPPMPHATHSIPKPKLRSSIGASLSVSPQVLEGGGIAIWTTIVFNSGESKLFDINIRNNSGPVAEPFYLNPGESTQITFETRHNSRGKTEKVSVSAQDESGVIVEAEASASVKVTNISSPELDVYVPDTVKTYDSAYSPSKGYKLRAGVFVLGIVGALLGFWGISHFFTGKAGKGILYLIGGFLLEALMHKTHHVAHLKRFKSHSLNGVCRTA
jgi:cell division ATPase FtsA